MTKTPANLDDVDRRLVELLRRDSRQPILALARAVGLSRSTVQERLARLIRDGVIRRFTVDTGNPLEATGVRAFFFVTIDGRVCGNGRPCEHAVATISGFPEIEACHYVSGPMDVVLSVRTPDLARLNALRERIAALAGVANVTAAPVLKTPFEAQPTPA